MTRQLPDVGTLVERMARLEKENRRTKQLCAVLLILISALVLMGQASPNRTVEANEFILRDEQGRTRAWLHMEADGPYFTLTDASGKGRLGLTVRETEGTGISMYDPYGKIRVALGEGRTGRSLAFYGDNGEQQVTIKDGPGMSGIHMGPLDETKQKQPWVFLVANPITGGKLYLAGPGGKPAFVAP
jgi:hypothetical protein